MWALWRVKSEQKILLLRLSLHHRPQRMLTEFIKHVKVVLYARRLRKEPV